MTTPGSPTGERKTMRRPEGYHEQPGPVPWATRSQSRSHPVQVCLTPDEYAYVAGISQRMSLPVGVCLRTMAFRALAEDLPAPSG